jgi:hypothetical protein
VQVPVDVLDPHDLRRSPSALQRRELSFKQAEQFRRLISGFHNLATFRRKIGWRWLLDRIDWFAENCKIGRIWVDVGRDH